MVIYQGTQFVREIKFMVIVLVNIQTNPVLFFYTGILGIATLIFKQTNLGVT